MPTSRHRKRRAPQPADLPDKMTNTDLRPPPVSPIHPKDSVGALLEQLEMNGNERGIGFFSL